MSKEKAVLYPFSQESFCITRNFNLTDYEIITAVVPGKLSEKCMNMEYFDAFACNNIMISNDFISSIEKCDTVIWGKYDYKDIDTFYHKVMDQMIEAMSLGKNVVCLEKLTDEKKSYFIETAEKNHVKFLIYDFDNALYEIKNTLQLEKIEIPIVTVIGLNECADKFDAQLFVRQALTKEYQVSQIGSKPYSGLFGIHPYPAFMFEQSLTDKEKVLNLNRYIYELSLNENSDVMILGVPGEMMKTDEYKIGNFGINLFLTSLAYLSDFTILCTGCRQMNTKFIKNMQDILQFRFSMPLDMIYLCNNRINMDSLMLDYAELGFDFLTKDLYETEKERIIKECPNMQFFDQMDAKEEFLEFFKHALR